MTGPDTFLDHLRRWLAWLMSALRQMLFGAPHVPAWDDVGDGFVSTVHA